MTDNINAPLANQKSRWQRMKDSDLWWSFTRNKPAMVSAVLLTLMIVTAFAAPLIAPQNPFDPAQLDLWNSELPPIWNADGQWPYLLGTDTQGRDILSAILYGSRISILIGVASVFLSLVIGLSFGLIAGYMQGIIDNLLMRIGDVLLSIPTILIAILVSAVVRQMLPADFRDYAAAGVLVLAITLSGWVQYARTVRAQTIVERSKEYVQAARLLKVPSRRIMMYHILPNTLTPILVAATLNFGMAILTEATLSFLGIGMPPSQPSLGTLIRLGNQFLFSGLWWITVFPVLQLCLLVVAVNVLGDWLRDALNPKLR
ncbi:ABC transporter permease [Pseudochrobactrum asaccharolyticum]|jgi:peptide/nickel transport system permease protein|uniref:Peptide/nickel transport system permease protein n=1 Tax=Pseudochrobactrum asaccharolyticum TaxID=354351 RepID=A0A366E4R3_9HYPH|nr:ABC transporter permease [Pseudochrobactrum asaccharolyticum]MDR2309996.1 ABC transporter permease [Brucellaceae bacterium]RBO97360.1 peptide/nickel transport system permease protein [Pseudochrobactrum asaccharolyticum]